jgi:hypothetical protein
VISDDQNGTVVHRVQHVADEAIERNGSAAVRERRAQDQQVVLAVTKLRQDLVSGGALAHTRLRRNIENGKSRLARGEKTIGSIAQLFAGLLRKDAQDRRTGANMPKKTAGEANVLFARFSQCDAHQSVSRKRRCRRNQQKMMIGHSQLALELFVFRVGRLSLDEEIEVRARGFLE